jgi:putative glutamine amidotransferase
MIPSLAEAMDLDALLDHFDGIVMTGAISNVHPPHYGGEPTADHEPYDHSRDSLTLRLIRAVIDRGIPLFCVCRGYQELNVVLGGTLETEIQRGERRLDHRSRKVDNLDMKYGPVHSIAITAGGMLEEILGRREILVNSLHRQGIARLAPGLTIEARAPDGIIEAVSVKGAKTFAIGVQWHPEYKAASNPDSVKLFDAFGDAVHKHAAQRSALRLARAS